MEKPSIKTAFFLSRRECVDKPYEVRLQEYSADNKPLSVKTIGAFKSLATAKAVHEMMWKLKEREDKKMADFGNPEIKMREIFREMKQISDFFAKAVPGFGKGRPIDEAMAKKMRAVSKEKFYRYKKLCGKRADLVMAWPFHFGELRKQMIAAADRDDKKNENPK